MKPSKESFLNRILRDVQNSLLANRHEYGVANTVRISAIRDTFAYSGIVSELPTRSKSYRRYAVKWLTCDCFPREYRVRTLSQMESISIRKASR